MGRTRRRSTGVPEVSAGRALAADLSLTSGSGTAAGGGEKRKASCARYFTCRRHPDANEYALLGVCAVAPEMCAHVCVCVGVYVLCPSRKCATTPPPNHLYITYPTRSDDPGE